MAYFNDGILSFLTWAAHVYNKRFFIGFRRRRVFFFLEKHRWKIGVPPVHRSLELLLLLLSRHCCFENSRLPYMDRLARVNQRKKKKESGRKTLIGLPRISFFRSVERRQEKEKNQFPFVIALKRDLHLITICDLHSFFSLQDFE